MKEKCAKKISVTSRKHSTKSYTREILGLALQSVTTGRLSCYAASKEYKVPKQTLRRKVTMLQEAEGETKNDDDQEISKDESTMCRLCLKSLSLNDLKVKISGDVRTKVRELIQLEVRPRNVKSVYSSVYSSV